jgi:hypothetical protein
VRWLTVARTDGAARGFRHPGEPPPPTEGGEAALVERLAVGHAI